MANRAKQQVIARKLSKLIRDPHAFVRDAKVPPLFKRAFEAFSPESAESRVLLRVAAHGGELTVTLRKPYVVDRSISTALCCPDVGLPCSDDRLFQALSAVSFVGFRKGYLFLLPYALGAPFQRMAQLEELFMASPHWERGVLDGVRNLVALNPTDIFPAFLRATNLSTRLILLVTRDAQNLDLIARLAEKADVVVLEKSVSAARNIRGIRTVVVDDGAQLEQVLMQLIVDHKDKEKNAFLSVFGEPDYVEDIDELMQSNVDAVLQLRELPSAADLTTFGQIAEALAERAQWLLLREQRYHQYRDLCDSGDLKALLLASLEGGCRYELRR